ncbi:hypothetical protein C0585_00320 [Candidatus Woesearchaeota archaeon]|nr:MAG: hypothetical protein C0585_00320 [Candidatus Woesearchaeota archaeon]
MNKEVENFRKQGYTELQIRNYYLQKGFNQTQINQMLSQNNNPEPKQKNHLIPLLTIILILVIAGNIYYFFFFTGEHYSNNPKNWIDETENGFNIDVEEAGKGESYVDGTGSQQEKTLGTVFSSEGWYKGNYFPRNYYENDKLVMSINQEMDPNDGVIDGFILERLESDGVYAYIFIDEDWEKSIPNTMVYYGKEYENEVLFDFSEQPKEGIYMMKIKDTQDRFEADYSIHYGGFYVGVLKDDATSTIISLS